MATRSSWSLFEAIEAIPKHSAAAEGEKGCFFDVTDHNSVP